MSPTANEGFRYERKFLVPELAYCEVESIVRYHPCMFSEIYNQRYVNNIYFDTMDLDNFFGNIDGSANRVKIRIRWYGDLLGYIEKPVLELKIKKGNLGRKESYLLDTFEVDEGFSLRAIADLFARSGVPEHIRQELKFLSGTLVNRYSRKYFQSSDRRFRITLDDNLRYYHVGLFSNSFDFGLIDDINLILELKYDEGLDCDVNDITNLLPFRLSKCSKYVRGIQRIWGIRKDD